MTKKDQALMAIHELLNKEVGLTTKRLSRKIASIYKSHGVEKEDVPYADSLFIKLYVESKGEAFSNVISSFADIFQKVGNK